MDAYVSTDLLDPCQLLAPTVLGKESHTVEEPLPFICFDTGSYKLDTPLFLYWKGMKLSISLWVTCDLTDLSHSYQFLLFSDWRALNQLLCIWNLSHCLIILVTVLWTFSNSTIFWLGMGNQNSAQYSRCKQKWLPARIHQQEWSLPPSYTFTILRHIHNAVPCSNIWLLHPPKQCTEVLSVTQCSLLHILEKKIGKILSRACSYFTD